MPGPPDRATTVGGDAPAEWKHGYAAAELLDVACPACGARRPRDLAEEFGIAIARCEACDLVYTRTPLPESQGHYGTSREAVVAKYSRIFRGEAPHPRDANYHEHLAQLERLRGPGDLLDVGAHCGFFLRVAREGGWRTVGVEPSAVNAELAREQFGLDVRTGFLEDLELPAESFDVVTLTDVLEHVPQPGVLLREIARVLRPGGRVFIKVPNVRYVLAKQRLLGRARMAVDDVFDAREHLVYYSDATLGNVLAEAGFEVELMGVPSPIQTGGALRRALRAGGPLLARRLPRGARLPLATDIVAIGRKPALAGHGLGGRELEARALRSIAAAGGLVVDAGGGAPFTKSLAEFRELFVDVDYRTFDVAADTKPDIVGDIHDLPFPDASVDAFICRSVLEHVRSPERAVAEMARALKPGGQLLLTVPSTYPYHARPGPAGYPDLWRFFEDTLSMLLADFRSYEIAREGGPATAVVLFLPFLNRRARWLRPITEWLDALVDRRRPHSNATVLVAWGRR
jgi:ubiquinone/menaquinone biosynthesis C-methylase UbiE